MYNVANRLKEGLVGRLDPQLRSLLSLLEPLCFASQGVLLSSVIELPLLYMVLLLRDALEKGGSLIQGPLKHLLDLVVL